MYITDIVKLIKSPPEWLCLHLALNHQVGKGISGEAVPKLYGGGGAITEKALLLVTINHASVTGGTRR